MGRRWPCVSLFLLLLVNSVLHVVLASFTTEPSAHHEVKALTNASANLPCDVDIEGCGSDIHSIKVYKNGFRVYVFVRSNDTALAMDSAEGDLARPKARAHLKLDTNPPTVTVFPVFLLDEGTYRCDVTYLHILEGCKSNAYVTLITLTKPSAPEIRFDDGGVTANRTRIGPFVEGTQLSLSCEASGGKPPAEVSWWNGTEKMGAENEPQLNAVTINVKLTRADLHSRFECQAINDALEQALVTWVDVDVHVRPLSVVILPPEEVMEEGKEVSLVCEVSGARPMATIVWLNGSHEVSDQAKIETEEIPETQGKGLTFTTRSTYTFSASLYDNGQTVRCLGQNQVMENRDEDPLEAALELDVHYAPRVKVVPEGRTVVNYTDAFKIECQYEANPRNLTAVRWLKDGVEINLDNKEDNFDDEYDDNSESEDEPESEEDGDDEPDLWIRTATATERGVYTCNLANHVGPGISSTSLFVDVLYPPINEIVLMPGLAKEHEEENVTLECNVISANPIEVDSYRWLKDDEIIAETENNTYILYQVDREDAANYSCMARNSVGYGPESLSPEELLVYYLPGLTDVNYFPPVVIKEKHVTLTCKTRTLGYPPASEYRWYRNDYELDTKLSVLYISKVTTAMISNFSCAAVNVIGEGPATIINFSESVYAPPTFIEKLPPTHGVLEHTPKMSLSCNVECFPLCAVHWLKNGEHIDLDKDELNWKNYYYITQINYEKNISANMFESVISTLHWNLTDWPNGGLTRDVDNANYTCQTSENLVGTEISSTTIFSVEYSPEEIHVFPEKIDVIEGNKPDPILCYAEGFPKPEFIWKFIDDDRNDASQSEEDDDDDDDNEDIVFSGPMLNLNYSISRDQKGKYRCLARNRHGELNITTEINVMYPPDCTIDYVVETGGTVAVICEVEANPEYISYEWFLNGQVWTDGIRSNGLTSIVRFPEKDGHFGNYTCIANNSIGSSKACSMPVSDKGGWWEKVAQNKMVFVWAAVIAAVILFIVLIILYCIIRKRNRKDEDGKKKKALPNEPDSRTFYENLPFHGLQPPPNKPFKPILPDLEYADVDFPAQPLNNNAPISKAKIVEKILEEADSEPVTGKTPARPPRSKPSTRK